MQRQREEERAGRGDPVYPDGVPPGGPQDGTGGTIQSLDTLEVGSANRIVPPPQPAAKTPEQKAVAAGMAGTEGGEVTPKQAATSQIDIGAQLAAAAPAVGAAIAAPIIAAGPTIGAGITAPLEGAASTFAAAFGQVGAQMSAAGASLAAAGSQAAAAISGGAAAAGSAYGSAAAAKISAAVANVTISVQHSGSVGGTADKGTNVAK